MAVMVMSLRDNISELWLVISWENTVRILLLLLMPVEKAPILGPIPYSNRCDWYELTLFFNQNQIDARRSHRQPQKALSFVNTFLEDRQMSTEIRNWDVVAKAMEAAGSTSSQMYIRAKALAEGKPDPMPTSFPQAPHSISAVAGWSKKTQHA